MGIYSPEITALENQVKALQKALEEKRQDHLDAGTNMEAIGDIDPSLNALISQIDEVNEAIEMLTNWDEGSPNGFHELAEEYDFSDPEQWHSIKSHFNTPTSNLN